MPADRQLASGPQLPAVGVGVEVVDRLQGAAAVASDHDERAVRGEGGGPADALGQGVTLRQKQIGGRERLIWNHYA